MPDAEIELGHAGHRRRLRQRFQKTGLEPLAGQEAVELILTTVARSDVKQPAKRLIPRFGDVRGILDAPIEHRRSVDVIPDVTSVALRAVRSAAISYFQQSVDGTGSLADPDCPAEFSQMRIGSLQHEVSHVAYLNSGYRLLRDCVEELEQGTVDRAAAYPGRIVEAGLGRSTAAIVLAPNHQNGNVNPSEHDRRLTRAIVLAAEQFLSEQRRADV